MDDWRREPGTGRYAQPELERRFLLAGAVPPGGSPRLIEDRYLDRTTLRLRRVTVDGESVFKLTQKVRADGADPATASITSIYLTPDEYAVLAQMPAASLTKSRTICMVDGTRFAIDSFDGHLRGLRLAEVEVERLDQPLSNPDWLGREVTHDDRFSGGRLSATNANQLADLLEGSAQSSGSAAWHHDRAT